MHTQTEVAEEAAPQAMRSTASDSPRVVSVGTRSSRFPQVKSPDQAG